MNCDNHDPEIGFPTGNGRCKNCGQYHRGESNSPSLEWKDTTTYRRGETRGENPTSWTLRTDRLRITVVSDHIHYAGQWIMHCPELNLSELQLYLQADKVGAKKAQERAVAVVRMKLEDMLSSLNGI